MFGLSGFRCAAGCSVLLVLAAISLSTPTATAQINEINAALGLSPQPTATPTASVPTAGGEELSLEEVCAEMTVCEVPDVGGLPAPDLGQLPGTDQLPTLDVGDLPEPCPGGCSLAMLMETLNDLLTLPPLPDTNALVDRVCAVADDCTLPQIDAAGMLADAERALERTCQARSASGECTQMVLTLLDAAREMSPCPADDWVAKAVCLATTADEAAGDLACSPPSVGERAGSVDCAGEILNNVLTGSPCPAGDWVEKGVCLAATADSAVAAAVCSTQIALDERSDIGLETATCVDATLNGVLRSSPCPATDWIQKSVCVAATGDATAANALCGTQLVVEENSTLGTSDTADCASVMLTSTLNSILTGSPCPATDWVVKATCLAATADASAANALCSTQLTVEERSSLSGSETVSCAVAAANKAADNLMRSAPCPASDWVAKAVCLAGSADAAVAAALCGPIAASERADDPYRTVVCAGRILSDTQRLADETIRAVCGDAAPDACVLHELGTACQGVPAARAAEDPVPVYHPCVQRGLLIAGEAVDLADDLVYSICSGDDAAGCAQRKLTETCETLPSASSERAIDPPVYHPCIQLALDVANEGLKLVDDIGRTACGDTPVEQCVQDKPTAICESMPTARADDAVPVTHPCVERAYELVESTKKLADDLIYAFCQGAATQQCAEQRLEDACTPLILLSATARSDNAELHPCVQRALAMVDWATGQLQSVVATVCGTPDPGICTHQQLKAACAGAGAGEGCGQTPMPLGSTTFTFTTELSLDTVKAALQATDLKVLELMHAGASAGGFILDGEESLADAAAEYALDYQELRGAAPAISDVEVEGWHDPAALGALAGAVSSFEQMLAPLEAPALGLVETGTVEPPTEASVLGPENDPLGWAPRTGRVTHGYRDGRRRPIRVYSSLQFPPDFQNWYHRENNFDWGYEHALWLNNDALPDINQEDSSCPNGSRKTRFWAYDPGLWDLHDPDNGGFPKAAKPYHDWSINDPCQQVGFQVGVSHPKQLKEQRRYDIIFTAKKGQTAASSMFLIAQRVSRWCYVSHRCAYNTPHEVVLIGRGKGRLPGCRLWEKGMSSREC